MNSLFDQLDTQLRDVAGRDPYPLTTRDPAPPTTRDASPATGRTRAGGRARRGPRRLIAVLAAVSLTGTAVAATGLWRPILGEPRFGGPAPTITASPPPPAQLAVLGVLRRPQTPADRSGATRDELQYLSPAAGGVRTAYIRLLSDDTGLGPAVLVPVARIDESSAGAPPAVAAELPHTDALCLVVGDRDGQGAAKRCFTTADVVGGLASLSVGSDLFGLVPDDVRRVTVSFTGGTARTVSPASNLFEIAMPAGGIPATMTWTTATGRRRRFTL
ncbi:MAG TPA: hypothetical protein VHW26_13780 [Solirubrobacteraceae bacterium]|jgi:hypothetical protein|nr:hypothetical protein [Solirubrobacteraceae bacterium]